MKKLITICLLMTVLFTVNAQEQKEYHANGKLSSIGKRIGGYANGEWKYYHENGQLNEIGNYINGDATGIWKFYHENGQLRKIGNYITGESNGEWKYYYENGQLENIGKYTDGKQDGEWKHYYKNGQLKQIGRNVLSKATGVWKFYFENGLLSITGNYIGGVENGEFKYYFETGQLKESGNKRNGEKTGEWKYYGEIKKDSIETKANNNLSTYKKYEFPQIQKYLDKINEIDLGYDKLAKLSQKLSGKTFTSIETYDGEVSKDYYENISWGDFKYAKYIEHEDAKMYIRCDFEFKTNFLKTTKYSSKEDNILSFFIFKKDILAVKQAIEEFEENQVQKFISTQNSTQRTEYKGAKTWKIVSFIMGENLENVKKILQNNNMVVKKNGIDKDTGLDIWNFVALSEKNDEYTSPYTVAFKNNKVVMAMVPYGYFSKETTNLLKDLSELKKDIKLFGFEFTDKQTEEHRSSFGGGVWYTFNYFFNKINDNKEVRIFYEPNMENFTLMIGEKKYLDAIKED